MEWQWVKALATEASKPAKSQMKLIPALTLRWQMKKTELPVSLEYTAWPNETLPQQGEGKNELLDNVYVHTLTPLIPQHTQTMRGREGLTKAITKNP